MMRLFFKYLKQKRRSVIACGVFALIFAVSFFLYCLPVEAVIYPALLCAVLSDGTVVPCCLDHEGDVPLGNLFSQELDEILRALPAQALLSGFAARKLTQPLCRRCGYARRFR